MTRRFDRLHASWSRPARALFPFLLLFSLAPAADLAQDAPLRLSVAARVRHEPLSELSGIVKSPRRENLYWVHNDSGHEARLFAIDGDGEIVMPTFSRFSHHGAKPEPGKTPWPGFKVLHAQNVDWEDITTDGNYLYIADTGNNLNLRRTLTIYMVSEIDPTASTQTAVIRRLPVRYPEQGPFSLFERHYDSESLFAADGKLYLITKHRKPFPLAGWEKGANLYRLDTRHTDRDNRLTLIDGQARMLAPTGAEVSPDGSRLAVITYRDLWIFDKPAQGDRWLSSTHRRIRLRRNVGQVEAVTWDDASTLVLANEAGEIFRLAIGPAR